MNKNTTKEIMDGKIIRITKKSWSLLKVAKIQEKKSMARILSDLIIEKYGNKQI